MNAMRGKAVYNQTGDGIVYSSLASLLRLQSQIRTLNLAKKHIRSRHAGVHRSVYKGRGMDFAESRPYQAGDDIRTLDWRVTARSGRLHTKIFEEEREKPVLVWVDLRSTMFFATRGQFKSVVAAEITALLMWKTLKIGDRFGGILQNGSHSELKPSRSRAAALNLLKQVSDLTQTGQSTQAHSSSDLSSSWIRLRRVASAGSQVFVISDFRQVNAQALRQLAMLTRHAQLSLIEISDPFEAHPPAQGQVRLTDGARKLWVNLGQKLWRQRYAERHHAAQQSLTEFARLHRLPFVQISTADDMQTRLMKLAKGLR